MIITVLSLLLLYRIAIKFFKGAASSKFDCTTLVVINPFDDVLFIWVDGSIVCDEADSSKLKSDRENRQEYLF